MERSLAHIEKIVNIQPIEGADKIELATVLGWNVIVSKNDNLKIGDKVIYIEIDSLVPEEDERFEFLRKRKFKVKTIKLKGQYSQGLILSLTSFPEAANYNIGDDVTDILKIKYYVKEDNIRKASSIDENLKYKAMASRNNKLFKKKPIRWLMRRAWGKKLLFLFFGKKKDKPLQFPSKFEFIHKTDETRCEAMPQILEDKREWIKTTKLDGTSATYILERKLFNKYEYYVCSRNMRQMDINQKNYHTEVLDGNVYWFVSITNYIKDKLKDYLDEHKDIKYICLQGEIVGEGIQGNPHKLKGIQFYAFNFIDSINGRWNSIEAANYWKDKDINWVPIIDEHYILPDTMEELKLQADGKCELPGATGLREGYVYRSKDGKKSFKNVSRKYLLKIEEEEN